jgi:hypothetical protein
MHRYLFVFSWEHNSIMIQHLRDRFYIIFNLIVTLIIIISKYYFFP